MRNRRSKRNRYNYNLSNLKLISKILAVLIIIFLIIFLNAFINHKKTLKTPIDTSEITNNNDKSFLIKTTENISNGLFSEYTYFNNSIKSFINTSIPLEYLYNILSLGNNLYLLKF